MTKEEALNKIEELKQYVDELDQQSNRILEVTQFPDREDYPRFPFSRSILRVNDRWVANIWSTQDMSDPTDFLIKLYDYHEGYWVDMLGNTVEGELRFIPKF